MKQNTMKDVVNIKNLPLCEKNSLEVIEVRIQDANGRDHFDAKIKSVTHHNYSMNTLRWKRDRGYFTRAVKEGLIIPEHSVQVGIRTIADDMGLNILDAPWVHENGTKAVIERIHEIVGDRKAYLTFDIDCLDPAYAPGTGTPVAGGLTSHQALTIVRGLGGINLVGMDIVEVAPAYDHSEITAIAAATIAHDYLCLLAAKKPERE